MIDEETKEKIRAAMDVILDVTGPTREHDFMLLVRQIAKERWAMRALRKFALAMMKYRVPPDLSYHEFVRGRRD